MFKQHSIYTIKLYKKKTGAKVFNLFLLAHIIKMEKKFVEKKCQHCERIILGVNEAQAKYNLESHEKNCIVKKYRIKNK